MSVLRIQPTGKEAFFGEEELIVSKTNLKGHIIYCNETMLRVSGFSEAELIGKPHNIVRHCDMPASVFKLLWDTIISGREIFAYVLNQCKNGDHYWVFAHVTPTVDRDGQVIGYHSNRRCPDREIVDSIKPIYREIRRLELQYSNKQEGVLAGLAKLNDLLKAADQSYDEFIWSLTENLPRFQEKTPCLQS